MGSGGAWLVLTLSEETRSAVSRRVNWPIWSTMAAILGLVGAAASVDCHLLERKVFWVDEREARTTGDWAVAHRLRTRWQESDIAVVCVRESWRNGGATGGMSDC